MEMPCLEGMKDYAMRFLLHALMFSILAYIFFLSYSFYKIQFEELKKKKEKEG